MSLKIEKARLLSNIEAYKNSLPDPPPPMPTGPGGLPNDAARAKSAIRTRTRRHGSSKLTPSGQATLSKSK